MIDLDELLEQFYTVMASAIKRGTLSSIEALILKAWVLEGVREYRKLEESKT